MLWLLTIHVVVLVYIEYVNHTPKRTEKMTLKRVMDFVKDKGDEGMNEKYRKSQRMLEETLTKNMCLQNVSYHVGLHWVIESRVSTPRLFGSHC